MTPTWNQPASPLSQALPSSFPSVGPNHPSSAYQSDRHQSSGMQTQEEWLAASPDGQALSPMTQVPMGRTVLPNKIIADLMREKQVKA
ncbi:TPA: hypothetical protein ACH3X1_008571 [Trebouxia sp. C0004]